MTDALVPVVETPAVDAAAVAEATSGVVPVGSAAVALPRVIVEAGPTAVGKFVEFFAGRIANDRTRAAYARAAGQFLGWCEGRGLRLEAVSPLHVAVYIRTHPGSAPTVKQHLAAIRMLCDWLVVSQILPVNPAAAVRGPKHMVSKGATPVLSPAEARKLLRNDRHGHPGRAPGPGAALGHALQLRAGERGPGDAAAGLLRAGEPRVAPASRERAGSGTTCRPTTGPPRPSTPSSRRPGSRSRKRPSSRAWTQRGGGLTGRVLDRWLVLAMIKRRPAGAGLPSQTCCHTFRATGITAYLSNGGTLEHAQQIASYGASRSSWWAPSESRTASPSAESERPAAWTQRGGPIQKAAQRFGFSAPREYIGARARRPETCTCGWTRGWSGGSVRSRRALRPRVFLPAAVEPGGGYSSRARAPRPQPRNHSK